MRSWWKLHPVWGWGAIVALSLALVVGAFVLPAAGLVETLRPNATSENAWTIVGGGASAHLAIDDVTPDDTTTMLSASATNQRFIVGFGDPISVSGTINSVTAYARLRGTERYYWVYDNGSGTPANSARSNGPGATTWADIQYVIPANGGSWDISEVNAVRVGFLSEVAGGWGNLDVTQMYLVVDYTPDTTPPSVTISTPADGATIASTPYSIAGTASDTGGSGLSPVPATVELRIGRDTDADSILDQYWSHGTSTWVAGETWFSSSAFDGTNWSYSWALPSEDRANTYQVDARATDLASNTGSADPATAVKVDTLGPLMNSATAVSSTAVDVVFSEPLSAASIAASDFTIDNGLTVSTAVLQADTVTVRLTTSAQGPGTSYAITMAGGTQIVTDTYGNADRNNTVSFAGFTPVPALTVAPGADVPAAKAFVLPGSANAVDQIELSASNGAVTTTQIVVRGLASGDVNTEVAGVALYEDDGDDVYGAGDTTQVGSTQTFSGGVATFSGLNYTVAVGSPKALWVVYTVAGTATNGTLGSEMIDGDITVTAPATVSFSSSPITSSNGGATLEVDDYPPLVSITSPLTNGLTIAQPTIVSGTALDDPDGAGSLTGSGVGTVQIRIARSNGTYWDGSAWVADANTWVPSTTFVAGTGNWTYSWTLPSGENADTYTYSMTARATDALAQTGTSPAVTGVRIDTLAPTIVSVTPPASATEVDVVFSEPLASGTIAAGDFTIAGLTVSNAALQPDNVTVRLTTSAQTGSQSYTIGVAAGALTDAQGVANPDTSGSFTGYSAGGTLTVSQSIPAAAPDLPVAPAFVAPGHVRVVDAYELVASGGDVTVGTIRITGLDTASALTSDVSAVRLYYDADADGLFYDDGADPLLGTAPFSGDVSGSGQAEFTGLGHDVTSGATHRIWVVYVIGGGATDGRLLGSRVDDGDIVATVGSVNAFASFTSGGAGQTLRVDALGPTITIASPSAGAVLTGTSATISGTASDASGAGVGLVQVKIARSDGTWWNGALFTPVETWRDAAGTTNWSYDWTPIASGQNRTYTYTVSVRAADVLSQYGGTQQVSVQVDNVGPAIASAVAANETSVDVYLSEPLDPATVALGDFSIPGLTISDFTLLAANTRVQLTTDLQTNGTAYVVSMLADAVRDPYGNPGQTSSAGFTGYGGSDTLPPDPPTNVAAAPGATAPLIAHVTWDAATDNVGVVGYEVYRSVTETGTYASLDTTPGLAYDDVTGIPGQSYWYKVTAYDAAGNESARSAFAGPVVATWTQAPHATYTSTTDLCRMCHDPHDAASVRNILVDAGGGAVPPELAVCYACHDGSGALANVKTGPTNSFVLKSGHALEATVTATTLTNTCASCHDPHRDYTSTTRLPAEKVNGVAITAADNTWCLACHNATNAWYGAGYPSITAPTRDATGYPVAGTFPGPSTYTSATANAHASIPASATASREAGDCLYCHASHRGPSAYDSLVATFTVPTAGTLLLDQTSGDFAGVCFGCHGTKGNPAFATPPTGATNIQQYVTAGGPRSGHRIKTAGGKLPVGSPLPCYDCHNPHGSGRGNARLISDERGASLETTTAAGVRAFCFTCHSSDDGFVWDSVDVAYEAVGTDSFEGLRRDGTGGNVLKLPTVDGHGKDDLQSCYGCHGSSYDVGGYNVHNPTGGESAGGTTCFACHNYQSMQSNTSYHHYMTSDATGYPDIDDPTTLATDDARRTCLTCHVDHDYFVPGLNTNAAHTDGRAQNLRSNVATAPAVGDASTYVNYDYADADVAAGGEGGVCTSCHKVRLTKNSANRKSDTDRFASTVPVSKDIYDTTAHNYFATAPDYMTESNGTTYTTDSSGVLVNCGKCHNDSLTKQFQTGPYTFGLHDSDTQALLTDGGQIVSTQPQEQLCYLCHSRAIDAQPNNPNGGSGYTGDMPDMYGGGLQMSAMMSPALNVKGVFTVGEAGASSHPVTGDGTTTSRVECESCHNPHKTEFSPGFGGPSGVVQDPDNTLVGSSLDGDHVYYTSPSTGDQLATNRDFCMSCHDGTTPAAVNNGTAYVPYSVFIAPAAAADANKSAYIGRSHANARASETSAGATTIALTCASCHDKHGSQMPALLGQTADPGGDSLINGQPLGGNDNSVCAACHTSATASFPAGEAQRDSNGYLAGGTWPGMTVYNTAYVAGVSGSPHISSEATMPGTAYAAGDCKNCHNVHGTANVYDELTRTFDPASAGNDEFALCFACHDGTKGADIKSLYPAVSGGTSTEARSGHRVLSSVGGATLAAGDAVPCYDCHNPHGSASASALQVRGIGDSAGEISLGSADGIRKFCFACHVPQDTSNGWSGSAWVDATGTSVEGISRTGFRLKLPTLVGNGHKQGDTADSCYTCHGGAVAMHSPTGGISNGGADCYGCHVAYQSPMEDDQGAKTGATNGAAYHHVLGASDGSVDGDEAFLAGSYPTSSDDVYCLSCHVDHDAFNSAKATNLRTGIGAETGAATDWADASNTGICTSCHATSRAKSTDGLERKSDGRSATPKVLDAQYDASAHKYSVISTYSGADFSASCSKCHNDEQTKTFQTSTVTFGTHWSATQHIVSALGGTVVEQQQEEHCYRCHSLAADGKKAADGTDWYGVQSMATVAGTERVYQQFQTASTHPVVAAGGDSVECESCHNPHTATTGSQKVADPDNTYTAYTYTTDDERAAFCLKCHDGTLPTRVVDATTYRPYAVTQADTALNNKVDTAKSSKGHWTDGSASGGSIAAGEQVTCAECHDNHGSTVPKLLGAYDPADNRNEINGVQISANGNAVCTACHTNASTSFPLNTRAANGYPIHGTWPGSTVYGTAYVPATHTGSPHTTANGGGSSTLPAYTAGDCKVCHDVHGTTSAYDELRATFTTNGFALCFDCHDTDGPAARNIKTYYPGGVGGSGGGSGHEIRTAGGTLPVGGVVPCYNCHNAHGSASSSYSLLVVTMTDSTTRIALGDAANEIRMSPADQATANNVRNFCFCCHTTADGALGWDGTGLTAVGVGATVEGLDRTTGTRLRLPNRSGHQSGNTTQSCYSCHGNDYASLSGNNIHNPSGGVSTGGKDCYTCHTTMQSYMEDDQGAKTGANNGTVYHHVLGASDGTSDGDKAYVLGSYPTSTDDVYCLSCHVDHGPNGFETGDKSSNLRGDFTNSPSQASTDWNDTTNTGVCTACHGTTVRAKSTDNAERKSDGRSATPIVANADYDVSAHKYPTTSTFSDSTVFNASCSKCHNDENNPAYKDFQTSANRFGPHWSATQHIVSALGGGVVEQQQEAACYRCHARTSDFVINGGTLPGTAKPTALRDWYDSSPMTAAAERVYAQFGLASKHPVVAAGGDSVECESCHNAHEVASGANLRASDPDNTYTLASYPAGSASADVLTRSLYCLKCHDGGLPTRTVTAGTYIPYSVTQASTAANNQDDTTLSSKGHWRVSGSITVPVACDTCHDNHGSSVAPLLGQYDMTDSRNEINGTQVTANNNTVCGVCHTAADAAWPTYTLAGTGYPTDGTWPGMSNYTNATYGIHRGSDGGDLVQWPGGSWADGDCKNCHDVHGTSNAYDELIAQFDSTNVTLCLTCHDGSPSAINIYQYYPTVAGGQQTQTASTRYGHKTETAGTLPAGSAMPCYYCHNPHGSTTAFGLMVRTETASGVVLVLGDGAGEFDIDQATGETAATVREFCFACHTTAGTVSPNTDPYGWNGSGYALVTAGAQVAGIDRTIYDSGNKRGLKLPAVSGHYRDDTKSCYDCHGNAYAVGSTNVHNPGPGGSTGGTLCYQCHTVYQGYMEDGTGKTGASRTLVYHHVLGGALGDGEIAPNTGSYPNSTTDVYCVSCHTDHNYFNATKGANLRQGIGLAGSATASSDYSAAAPYGICVSCHTASLPKDTTNQKSSSNTAGADPSANTPAISGPLYDASKHQYAVTSEFGTGNTFNADCSKCHNDEQTKEYQSTTNTFGTHWSSTRRVLAALGYTGAELSDPLGDTFCYKCHKSNNSRYAGNPYTNGNDYYNTAQGMTTNARTVADSMFATNVLAIINGSTTVRSYDVATDTWGTLVGTPATAPGAGSNLVFHGGNFAYFPGASTAFQMMDPYGTADANKTPATPRWAASGGVMSPVLPAAANTGAAMASDGVYLYYLQGNTTVKAYRLNTADMNAGDLQTKTWVDTTAGSTKGMADALATIGDGGSLEWAGGDYLYALRGGATTTAYQYRISTDTWNDANAADLPLATAGSADLCWAGGGYIYAIRGTGTNNFYRGTIDAAGAITGWTAMTSPAANFGAGADLTWDGGTYVYAFQGGSTAFWRYNTVTNTWATMAAAPATVGANTSLVTWRVAGHSQDDASAHRTDEGQIAAEGWMPSTSRHATCADCHEVHQATTGTHAVATTSISTKDLGGANEGVWGTEYAPPTYVAGTATFTNGSATVNGSGTTWTAANGVYAGSWIQNNADKHYYQIATVNSATQLTLAVTYKGATATNAAYTLRLGYTGGTSATFTKGSKTVTGTGTSWTTTVIPVGSYIRSNDLGTWYRVVSVDSATQLTVNDEYRGSTYSGGYNVIRVAFTKVASGSVTRQYQLCFKCHTGYAWGTGAPPTGQSSGPWGRGWKQTDVAVDFDPVNYSYHPLFQRGRNQPPSSANGNWDGTAVSGNKAATYSGGANPNTGLDNTFVDGWGTQSLVACTDCHDHPTPATAPSGPHGSSYRWLLKGLDPDATVTLVGGTVRYPNRAGGTSGGTPYSTTALCANCHRGDVYRVSASQYLSTTYPDLARFDHLSISDGNCVPSLPQDGDSQATYWPNGCMNCHGGDTPGAIHGTSRGESSAHALAGDDAMGKRFTNGSSWDAHTLGTTGTGVTCFTIDAANDVSNCTQHNGTSGRNSSNLNYDYDWE